MLVGVLLSFGYYVIWIKWRWCGFLFSALDSGPRGLSLNHGQGHCVVILVNILTLIVPLSTLVYKWAQVNLMLVVLPCDGLASHPA